MSRNIQEAICFYREQLVQGALLTLTLTFKLTQTLLRLQIKSFLLFHFLSLRFFPFFISYLNLIASYHGHQRINRPDRPGHHAYIERLQVLYYGSLPSLTKDTSFIVSRITTERLTRFPIYI